MIILIAVCRIEEREKNEGRKLGRRLFKELRYEVRQVEDTMLERERLMREGKLDGSGGSNSTPPAKGQSISFLLGLFRCD